MGIWDVQSLLLTMSWDQFMTWYAYYQLEPFGEERGDLRSGIVASTIANVNRDSKKRPRPFKPEDFMPKYDGHTHERKPLTDPDDWARVKQSMLNLKGSV